jgi:hypothetical protein
MAFISATSTSRPVKAVFHFAKLSVYRGKAGFYQILEVFEVGACYVYQHGGGYNKCRYGNKHCAKRKKYVDVHDMYSNRLMLRCQCVDGRILILEQVLTPNQYPAKKIRRRHTRSGQIELSNRFSGL